MAFWIENWTLALVLAGCVAAVIWFIGLAFYVNLRWGIAVCLVPIPVGPALTILHWKTVRLPFLLFCAMSFLIPASVIYKDLPRQLELPALQNSSYPSAGPITMGPHRRLYSGGVELPPDTAYSALGDFGSFLYPIVEAAEKELRDRGDGEGLYTFVSAMRFPGGLGPSLESEDEAREEFIGEVLYKGNVTKAKVDKLRTRYPFLTRDNVVLLLARSKHEDMILEKGVLIASIALSAAFVALFLWLGWPTRFRSPPPAARPA